MNLHVLGANVSLGGQEHLDVLAGGVENAGQVGGSHDCGCDFDEGGELAVRKVSQSSWCWLRAVAVSKFATSFGV